MNAASFVDVEGQVGGWLARCLKVPVASETPHDLASRLPFVRVVLVGGSTPNVSLDAPLLAVDAFAADRPQAIALANRVRTLLSYGSLGADLMGGRIGQVSTVTAPLWAPWDNSSVRRYTATYRITLHAS